MKYSIFTTFGLLLRIHITGGSIQCGSREHSLVGFVHHGWKIDEGQWPWHVALFHDDIGKYACGATLLSQWHVLTAAHCVTYQSRQPLPADSIVLHFGQTNLSEMTSNVQVRHVGKVHVHPNYSKHKNDIALLELRLAIEYSEFVMPICLDKRADSDLRKLESTRGWIPGWGRTENGLTSDVLRTVSMPVVSFIECLQADRLLFGRVLDRNMFCAGDRNGSSPGFGDSGGGIYFINDDRWVLRGIVSFGKIDEARNKVDTSKYTVFVNVQRYLTWIQDSMGEDITYLSSRRTSEKDSQDANAPPQILVARNWRLRENTVVNTLITQVRAEDDDNDELEFGLESFGPGQLQPFVIDSNTGDVYLNESIEGKGGQNFFVYVAVTDGRVTSKNEVYVNILSQNASGLYKTRGPQFTPNLNNFRKILPPGFNLPPGFSSIPQAPPLPPPIPPIPTQPLVVSQPSSDEPSTTKQTKTYRDWPESITEFPGPSATTNDTITKLTPVSTPIPVTSEPTPTTTFTETTPVRTKPGGTGEPHPSSEAPTNSYLPAAAADIRQ